MSDYASYCSDCARITDSVSDHATGDLICSDCGLVLDSHLIDESCEWRTFSNSDSTDDHDPNRVGQAMKNFLTSQLLTFTSNPKSTPAAHGLNPDSKHDSLLEGVGPTAYRATTSRKDQQSTKALAKISDMCDQLGLNSSIQDLAKHLYSTHHQKVPSSFRGKLHDAFLGACVYVVCTQQGFPRTVKEISSVANAASKKDILRAKAFVAKNLLPDADLHKEDKDNYTMARAHEKAVRAGDLVRRFCSNVGMMNHQVMKAAQEAVDRLERESNVGRSPVSVAATIVYVIKLLWDDNHNDDNNNTMKKKKSNVEEIANATGVGKNTIMKTYMDMYPHLWKIVPCWFAQPHQISRLHRPPTRLDIA